MMLSKVSRASFTSALVLGDWSKSMTSGRGLAMSKGCEAVSKECESVSNDRGVVSEQLWKDDSRTSITSAFSFCFFPQD